MYTLLCRVMVFVFLINCLTPSTGWGQTRRHASNQSLDAQLKRKVAQAQSQNTPAWQFFQADRQIRQAHNDAFAAADVTANKQKHLQLTLPQDKTRVEKLPATFLASKFRISSVAF